MLPPALVDASVETLGTSASSVLKEFGTKLIVSIAAVWTRTHKILCVLTKLKRGAFTLSINIDATPTIDADFKTSGFESIWHQYR